MSRRKNPHPQRAVNVKTVVVGDDDEEEEEEEGEQPLVLCLQTIIIFQILALSKLSLSHFSLSFSSSDGIVLRQFVVVVGVVVLPDRRHDLFRVFSLLHSLLLGRRVKIDDTSSVKAKETLAELDTKGQRKTKKTKNERKEMLSFLCPTFFTTLSLSLSLSLCRRVHRNSAENEHTRHANKKCSPHPRLSEPRRSRISSELRRNHAVPRYVPLVAFRAESVDFFSFLVFLFGRSEKESNLVAKWSAWFIRRLRRAQKRWTRDGRTTVRFCPEIYSSRKCVRRKRYFRASLASRSGFPTARARDQRLCLERKKARKNLKTGLFSRFRLSISSLTKKNKFLTKFSLMCTPLNTDCKVHGVHG